LFSTPGGLVSQLADIAAAFEVISERARLVVGRLEASAVALRPGPDKWSVAECLGHLTITANAYVLVWRDAIDSARAAGLVGREPFTLDLWGRAFCWFLEPPPKVRFLAPRAFRPVAAPDGGRALPAFLESQSRLLEAIGRSDGLPLDRIRIRSVFERHVRYSLWSSFCANASHHRRHVWQAEQAATEVSRALLTPPSRR
jgi:hypothetical protein